MNPHKRLKQNRQIFNETISKNSHQLCKRPKNLCIYNTSLNHFYLKEQPNLLDQFKQQMGYKLVKNMENCIGLMLKQKNKVIEHYKNIQNILLRQSIQITNLIDQQMQKIKQSFERHKSNIDNQIFDLKKKQSHKKIVNKQIDKIKNSQFDIQLLKVQLPNITDLENDLKKYSIFLLQQLEPDTASEQQPEQTNEFQDKSTQTDLVTQFCQPEAITRDEMQDLLSCDQQLASKAIEKLSLSSKRRKKYAVGRRDIIRQEDEFSQSSSVVSEN